STIAGPEAPSRAARRRISEALQRELMGPYDGPHETFSGEYPTSRYIVGRLAPVDEQVSTEENDALAAGQEEEEENGPPDEPLPLVLGFHPSSIGLSFVIDGSCSHIDVRVTWGDYRREVRSVGEQASPDGHSESETAGQTPSNTSDTIASGAWQRFP